METKLEKSKRLNSLITPIEERKLKLIDKRIAHLDEELDIKSRLGFNVIDPNYEYENHPDYLLHMIKSFELTIEEEKLNLDYAKLNIARDMETREQEIQFLEDAQNE